MAELLNAEELPRDFQYPREFVRVVDLGLVDLEPWHILEGDLLKRRHRGLRERFPKRSLVLFAARQDNDDVACWNVEQGVPRVTVVHDYASPGWEQRAEFSDFHEWLRQAVEDLIEFDG